MRRTPRLPAGWIACVDRCRRGAAPRTLEHAGCWLDQPSAYEALTTGGPAPAGPTGRQSREAMNVVASTGAPQGDRGDSTAMLTLLYERHWSDLIQYVNRKLSDRHQAEEIAQETMLRAWRHAEQLAPERGSVWGWLSRVAHNLTVDHIRYKRARLTEVNESFAAPNLMAAVDHSDDVVDSIHLANIIAQLPRAQREVLYLIYWQNRTCAEAAAILDVPVGTVKSRLHQALRHLRTLLGCGPSHRETAD